MSYRRTSAHAIADALLAGPWNPVSMRSRIRRAVGASGSWIIGLVAGLRREHPGEPPSRNPLIARIEAYDPFVRAFARGTGIRVRAWLVPRSAMRPAPRWLIGAPILDDVASVARWLGATDSQLERFAERDGHAHRPATRAHRNYTYRWMAKRSGGARLLEAPRPRLRTLQQTILHELLDRVPAHRAAHGFVRGRSALTHARAHIGRDAVLRIDLTDFFSSIRYSRVHALFATLGYPESVARALASICTHATPHDVLYAAPAPRDASEVQTRFAQRQRLRERHLPQGAPTSPALANLAAFRLDVRLDAFARRASIHYTRYADDLTFSGGPAFARSMGAVLRAVVRIATEEGFRVNARKTRRMRRGARQSVAGIVVNSRLNVPRDAFERLEATLCNCARHGPSTQNREGHPDFRAHLTGRVAWVASVNAARGERLRHWLERIDWNR